MIWRRVGGSLAHNSHCGGVLAQRAWLDGKLFPFAYGLQVGPRVKRYGFTVRYRDRPWDSIHYTCDSMVMHMDMVIEMDLKGPDSGTSCLAFYSRTVLVQDL